MEMEKGIWWN